MLLLLPVKNRILVLRQHLFFSRHLLVPSLDRFRRHAPVALQRRADGVDDLVDEFEPFALARFLERGELPGDFPRRGRGVSGGGVEVGGSVEGEGKGSVPEQAAEERAGGCEHVEDVNQRA